MKKVLVFVLVLLMMPTIALADSNSVEHERHVLDTSSRQSFITDVYETYGIVIRDRASALSGRDGVDIMNAIDYTLSSYTPEFVQMLAYIFRTTHNAPFIIDLLESRQMGGGAGNAGRWINVWNPSTNSMGSEYRISMINTYNISSRQVNSYGNVFAHEFGHAVHHALLYVLGTRQAEQMERDFTAFNGNFRYTGTQHGNFNMSTHGTTFVSRISLEHWEEDVAEIFAYLTYNPTGMVDRISNTRNQPLLDKTIFLRDMVYEYIGFTPIFAPVYEALEILEQ